MKLVNVNKSYGKTQVLRDLNLEIEEGKITAILGASGAGKTTLLNVLARLTPFEGELTEAKQYSYIFQTPKLLPNLTAEGNLKFVLPKERWGDISEMLARVGLAGKENRYPRELSGGEAQRVAIARAFLFPHELLLMDEPFSSLDLGLKKTLLPLVYGLWKERGGTVVFVTHDMHEAALLAHRVVVLGGGRVAADISVPEPFLRDFFGRSRTEERLFRLLAGEEE